MSNKLTKIVQNSIALRIFIFFGLLLSSISFSQETRVTREWGTYFGRSNPTTVIQTNDSILVFGTTGSTGLTADQNFRNSRVSSTDYFITIFSNEEGLEDGRYINTSTTGYANMLFDNERNYYFFGTTSSTLSDLVNSHDNTFDGVSDFYFGKLDRDWNLKWSSLLGGNQRDVCTDAVIDLNGNLIVVGYTFGSTTGIANNGHQNSFGGNRDGIIAKFDKDGNQLWSSYYGGSNLDELFGVDVDDDGNIYVCGFTRSSSGIAFNGYDNSQYAVNNFDAFLVKFDKDGSRIWGTYFGGDGIDRFQKLQIVNNIIYCVGDTQSSDVIGENGFDNSFGGNYDGLIAVFNTDGGFEWSSYLGGSGDDRFYSLDIGEDENIYLLGTTSSTINFATNNAFQITYGGGNEDPFFAKVSNQKEVEVISYLGGNGSDERQPTTVHKGINIDSLLIISFQTQSDDKVASNNGFINTRGGASAAINAFKLEYLTTLIQTTGGEITANKSGYIQHGQPLEIEFTPDRGYFLKNIIYNGDTLSADAKLEIEAVRNPVNVSAIWKIDPLGDIDGDGITNQVELDAPNDGDANGDSTLDIFQLNVASIQDSVSQRYITIQSSEDQIQDIKVSYEESDTYIYPYGLNEFKLNASFDSVKIIYHDISDLSGFEYRKLSSKNQYFSFQNYRVDEIEIDGKTAVKVTLFLTDGGPEDYDGVVNGAIHDPGGPALPAPDSTIPIWDWWHLAVLGGIIGIWFWRKK